MTEPYTFVYHPSECVLELTLSGRWEPEDVDPYYDALVRFATAHVTGAFHVLTDLRDYPVQTQAVVARHVSRLTELQQGSPVDREAWVVSPKGTAALQANRGTRVGDQHVDTFASREEAWAHLTRVAAVTG